MYKYPLPSIIFIYSLPYYGVLVDTAPKQSYLVCIVYLHHIKLLDYFLVNNEFSGFEVWNDLFAKVNCHDVIKLVQ